MGDPVEIHTATQNLKKAVVEVMKAEAFEMAPDNKVIIKLPFFQELITARATLWALQSAGVDSWDGYADALSEPLGDEWVKELD